MRLWRGARSSLAFGLRNLDGIAAEANLFFCRFSAVLAAFRLTQHDAAFVSGEVASYARNS